jgi:signal transduction histidine kinase
MGGLILLSLASVTVGFWTARRAFWRQHHLNAMKTNFVSSVSHELRAPIASMRLMAEELEILPAPSESKWQKYAGFIVQESRRLSALIENVLDFARYEEGRKRFEFEPTDIVALVEETNRLMRVYAAQQKISVCSRITGEPIEIEVDGHAIQQVLVNLLDNAIKNSPSGGTIEATLEFSNESKKDGSIVLSVRDEGCGIPEEDHQRIFEPFYRRGSELRRETQGVGLGLAIVKQAVEAHGGCVTVESKPGHGSRFIVCLPVNRKPLDYGTDTGN